MKRDKRVPKRSGGARGPKPSITLEVVHRVAERYGRGMPLRLCLEAEAHPKINVGTWEKALQKNQNFRAIWQAARGKFLDESMQRLQASDDLRHLCWLLERRHSDLFARQPEHVVNVSNTVSIPDEIYQRAREIAERESKEPKPQPAAGRADG